MVKGLRVFYRPDLDKNLNLFFKLIVSTIPIIIMGYFFGKSFDYNIESILLIIGLTSVIFAIVLLIFR